MLAVLAMLRVLRRPKLLKGLLQYFIYPSSVPFKQLEAEWLTLVVDAKHRNKGIANALTLSLFEEYRKRGVKSFKSTVSKSNVISCGLHDKLGFKFLGTFPLFGDQINIYEYELSATLKNGD